MIQIISILVLLSGSSIELGGATSVRAYNGKIVVEQDDTHYAVANSELAGANIAAASVNGNDISIYSNNCQFETKTWDDLAANESSLIRESRSSQSGSGWRSNQMNRFSNVNIGNLPSSSGNIDVADQNLPSTSGNWESSSFSRSSSFSSGSSSSSSSKSYTYMGSGLTGNLNGLVRQNDLITFIYTDNKVLMKPISCMDAQDRQLVSYIETQMEENQRRIQDQMEQNRRRIQEQMANMNQRMQEMSRNMANMFNRNFGAFY